MQLRIQARDVKVPNRWRSYAARRVRLALGRLGDGVGRVTVAISECGDKCEGSIQGCCRIKVAMPSAQRIVVREVDAELHAAIDRASERIGRKCARALDTLRVACQLGPRMDLPRPKPRAGRGGRQR